MTALPTPHRHLWKYFTARDRAAHLLPSYSYASPSRLSHIGCLHKKSKIQWSGELFASYCSDCHTELALCGLPAGWLGTAS